MIKYIFLVYFAFLLYAGGDRLFDDYAGPFQYRPLGSEFCRITGRSCLEYNYTRRKLPAADPEWLFNVTVRNYIYIKDTLSIRSWPVTLLGTRVCILPVNIALVALAHEIREVLYSDDTGTSLIPGHEPPVEYRETHPILSLFHWFQPVGDPERGDANTFWTLTLVRIVASTKGASGHFNSLADITMPVSKWMDWIMPFIKDVAEHSGYNPETICSIIIPGLFKTFNYHLKSLNHFKFAKIPVAPYGSYKIEFHVSEKDNPNCHCTRVFMEIVPDVKAILKRQKQNHTNIRIDLLPDFLNFGSN